MGKNTDHHLVNGWLKRINATGGEGVWRCTHCRREGTLEQLALVPCTPTGERGASC